MATNFATDSLKSVMPKAATGPTSSVTTSDSAVAEFRSHQPLHQDTQSDASTGTAQHGTPTLSDSAVAELKAAYVAVEHAIAEAKSSTTGSSATDGTAGSTGTDKAVTDTAATDTWATDKTPADTASHKAADSSTHQPPADPLVKVLADATGETAATVQGVLQQVRAVLHQEHVTDASGHAGMTQTTADAHTTTGTSTETSSNATTDAKTGDAPHWHDRLVAQHDGSGTPNSTDASTGQAAADAGSAIWQHFLNHYTSADSAVTTNASVVAAVDGFVDTVQSLHLDHGHGQMHDHGTDGAHLDTAT